MTIILDYTAADAPARAEAARTRITVLTAEFQQLLAIARRTDAEQQRLLTVKAALTQAQDERRRALAGAPPPAVSAAGLPWEADVVSRARVRRTRGSGGPR